MLSSWVADCLDRASLSTARLVRPGTLAIGLLLGALLFVAWPVIFADRALTGIDLQLIFYPYRNYIGDSFAEHRIPLWNPYNALGVPFAANPLARVFYPIDWLFLPLRPHTAITVSVLTHFIVSALGMWLFAKRSLKLGAVAQLVAVAAFTLSGVMMARVAQPNFLVAIAWIPWAFLAGERLACGRHSSWLLALSVVIAVQFLGGHPQYTWMTITVLLPWMVFCSLRTLRRPLKDGASPSCRTVLQLVGKRIAIGASAWMVAGLLAAGLAWVQLAPSIKLWSLSARRIDLDPDFLYTHALTNETGPAGLLPLFQTIPPTGEIVGYVGFVAAAMAVAALVIGVRRSEMWFFAVAAVFTTLLAYGDNPAVFDWYSDKIPGVASFRAPARWLALSTFAVTCLAAIGVNQIPRLQSRNGRIAGVSLTAGLMAATAVAMLTIADDLQGLYTETTTLWAIAGMFAVAIVIMAVSIPRFPAHIIPIAIVVELAIAARPYDLHTAIPSDAYRRPGALATLVRDDGYDGRILSVADVDRGDLFLDPVSGKQRLSTYAEQLNAPVLNRFSDAITNAESGVPNLNMIDKIPSADLYDGGLGISRQFIEFQQTIIPNAGDHSDYTLRTKLGAIPNPKVLDFFNVRYLVDDTVHDGVVEDMYVDMDLDLTLRADDPVVRINLPETYRATAVMGFSFIRNGSQILDGVEAGRLALIGRDGSRVEIPLLVGVHTAEGDYDGLTGGGDPIHKLPGYTRRWRGDIRGYDSAYYFDLDAPVDIVAVDVWSSLNDTAEFHLRGLTLHGVDGSSMPVPVRAGGQLQLLTGGPAHLTHQTGLKVYRNDPVLPRVRVVRVGRIASDVSEALAMLSSYDFDASSQVVLQRDGPAVHGLRARARDFLQHVGLLAPRYGYAALTDDMFEDVRQVATATETDRLILGDGIAGAESLEVVNDGPENVVVRALLKEPGFLILADAIYPDWQVTIDGDPAHILRANHHFRAVMVAAGDHVIEFRYEPADFRLGWIISAITTLGLIIAYRAGAVGRLLGQPHSTPA